MSWNIHLSPQTRPYVRDEEECHSIYFTDPRNGVAGKPRLASVQLSDPNHTIIPADYEMLVRKAILDQNKRLPMHAINTRTGEEVEFTFEEHLKEVGLTEEEWEEMMNEAITDYFAQGGSVQR